MMTIAIYDNVLPWFLSSQTGKRDVNGLWRNRPGVGKMNSKHILFKSFRSKTEESLPQRKVATPLLGGKDVSTTLHSLWIESKRNKSIENHQLKNSKSKR